jgi:hypothetical protein
MLGRLGLVLAAARIFVLGVIRVSPQTEGEVAAMQVLTVSAVLTIFSALFDIERRLLVLAVLLLGWGTSFARYTPYFFSVVVIWFAGSWSVAIIGPFLTSGWNRGINQADSQQQGYSQASLYEGNLDDDYSHTAMRDGPSVPIHFVESA